MEYKKIYTSDEALVSDTLIDSSDDAINAQLPDFKAGAIIYTAGYAKVKQKALDNSWVNVQKSGGSSGIDTSDATATAASIKKGDTAYISGGKVVGTMQRWDTDGAMTVYVDKTEADAGASADNYKVDDNEKLLLSHYFKPDASDPNTIMFVSKDDCIKLGIEKEKLAAAYGVSADKIKQGETIMGVDGSVQEGVDTSDATATATDIVAGKSAYVNGHKVSGSIHDYGTTQFEVGQDSEFTNIKMDGGQLCYFYKVKGRIAFSANATIGFYVTQGKIADVIGLTADKIKSGETILGVAGTVVSGGGSDDTITIYLSQYTSTDNKLPVSVPKDKTWAEICTTINDFYVKNVNKIFSYFGAAQLYHDSDGNTAVLSTETPVAGTQYFCN